MLKAPQVAARNTIPSSVTALMKTAVSVATLFASRHAEFIAFDRDFLRKRRDECRRQRAFSEQIAQQIRQSKRHQERIEISSRAEKTGKNRFANQAKHATPTGSPCPPLPPRACFLADLRPQSSANKEQRPTIWESKNFKEKTKWPRQCAHSYFKKRFMLSRSMMP